MQEVREMGRKEDVEEVGFPGLWMGMIVVGFQQEEQVWELIFMIFIHDIYINIENWYSW